MKKVFIYGLANPNTGVIRYIGKAKDLEKRLKRHIYDSRYKNRCPKHKWINGLKRKPRIVILEEVEETVWIDREKHWIASYRNKGARLTNLLSGGGTTAVSEETKEKISLGNKKAYKRGWKKSHYLKNIHVRPVIQYDTDMIKLKEFGSLRSAVAYLGCKDTGRNIIHAIRNDSIAYGYKWEYARPSLELEYRISNKLI